MFQKLIFLEDLSELNYAQEGLQCGLEIHQQLNCGKLFSPRPCRIVNNEDLNKEIVRNLRFSLSETGESDKAAEQEFRKQKYNIYKYNDEIASLVDLDEEPPIGPNEKALETGVQIAQMMNIQFFDAIQFMRKLIIDGSVTSGFQRTAMLGIGGNLETSFGSVEINGVNIEEDSCRPIERASTYSIFSLDRQGIPLLEITTGPQAKSPEQVYELALLIGNILRSFDTTKRGLGTIRQDLNVSITQGARVEIKGAQNLKLIKEIVEQEVKRQKIMHSIKEELEIRNVSCNDIMQEPIIEITECFKECDSSIINENLNLENAGVMGMRLKGFKGIMGHEIHSGYRFGLEVSDRNKAHFSSIKGLFHLDELPKYGIGDDEISKISSLLDLGELDNFVFIVYEKEYATQSLENIKTIICEMMQGVSSEVRQVDSKGTKTVFLRPMPGSARMYPETDVPFISLDEKKLKNLESKLPELYDDKIKRIQKNLGVDYHKTQQLLEEFSENQLQELLKISNKNAQELYSIVFDIPKDIKKREGVEPQALNYSLLQQLLELTTTDNLSQKAIRDIFLSLYNDNLQEIENLRKYVEEKQLIVEQLNDEELKNLLQEVVENNKEAPFGAIMGQAVKAVNGRADGKRISEMLKSLLQ